MDEYTPVEQLSYNEAKSELEGIVNALQSNNLELEAAVDNFKRGNELVEYMRQRLQEAENKINENMSGASTDEN